MADHHLPLPIVTPRLVIRDPVRSDMRGWSVLYRSPRVRRYMNGPLKRTASEWWTGNQQVRNNVDRPLSIVFLDTDELVGACGFLNPTQSNEWELWLLIRAKFWGKAIGHEVMSTLTEVAFSSMGAHLVTGIVNPQNHGSIRMITKLGFSLLREYSGASYWQRGHHVYGVERHTYNPAAITGEILLR